MDQTHETLTVRAVRGSETSIAAGSGNVLEIVLDPPARQGLDEVSPFKRIGETAAEIVQDLVFRRQVERLCSCPRVMVEFLAEIAAERGIRTIIEEKLKRYCSLTDEALALTGGDQMPSTPLHAVAT